MHEFLRRDLSNRWQFYEIQTFAVSSSRVLALEAARSVIVSPEK